MRGQELADGAGTGGGEREVRDVLQVLRSDKLPSDGRARRALRSREAIENALYELVGEGRLSPTAQEVAERANVGLRSVFRHFADMEALYATLDARLLADVLPILRQGPPTGGVRERATALVAKRAAYFERIAPYKRASDRRRWSSPFLVARHRRLVAKLRADLLRWLPELAAAPAELVEALDQATSFEAWDRLRGEQRLGRSRAAAAMEQAALALIECLRGRRA
jgi:AcrR family transcriptional regulator